MADNRISNDVEEFSNITGFVIYFVPALPPVLAVSATKSGVVPETSRVGSIAKSVLIGGALGGFFDDPPKRVHVTPQRNIIRAIPNTFNNTTDNTESGF